jgi:hypothetical protein
LSICAHSSILLANKSIGIKALAIPGHWPPRPGKKNQTGFKVLPTKTDDCLLYWYSNWLLLPLICLINKEPIERKENF